MKPFLPFSSDHRSVEPHAGKAILASCSWFLLFAASLGAQGANTIHYFPQIVINGGSTTSFSLFNPSPEQTRIIEIQLYSPAGVPLVRRERMLEPLQTRRTTFTGQIDAPVTAGWAELRAAGDFVATEFIVLCTRLSEPSPEAEQSCLEQQPRIGVLPTSSDQRIVLFGSDIEERRTGLAISNPNPNDPTGVTIRVLRSAGDERGRMELRLEPRQQVAAFLNDPQLFDGRLGTFEGSVEVTASPLPVAALSLEQERRSATIVSVPTVPLRSSPLGIPDEFAGSALNLELWRALAVTPDAAGNQVVELGPEDAPPLAEGLLQLAGDESSRREIQSFGRIRHGALHTSITSTDWAGQHVQGTDSTFGFELFQDSCRFAVQFLANGYLRVIGSQPDAEGTCDGEGAVQQSLVPLRNTLIAEDPACEGEAIAGNPECAGTVWSELLGAQRLHVHLVWSPAMATLQVSDGAGPGARSVLASYTGPLIPDVPLAIRFNADLAAGFAIDYVRLASLRNLRPPAP